MNEEIRQLRAEIAALWHLRDENKDLCNELKQAEAELYKKNEALELEQANVVALQKAFHDLRSESEGVYGLHLNGDNAPWDSLCAGGQFEEWCSIFDVAYPGAGLLAELRQRAEQADAELSSKTEQLKLAEADAAALLDFVKLNFLAHEDYGHWQCNICGSRGFSENLTHQHWCILAQDHPGTALLARHAAELAAQDAEIERLTAELTNAMKDRDRWAKQPLRHQDHQNHGPLEACACPSCELHRMYRFKINGIEAERDRLRTALETLKADARRYRFLVYFCSWHYGEDKGSEPSPAEAGISVDWQGGDHQWPGWDQFIDSEIARKAERCPVCDGTGAEDMDGDKPIKCSECNGTGHVSYDPHADSLKALEGKQS